MAGCAPCAAAAAALNNYTIQNQRLQAEQSISNEDCPYKFDTLVLWLKQLKSVKANEQTSLINITIPQVNSYIGYVQSAINYSGNLCFFADYLAPIVQVINTINAELPPIE